jgi:hypothetical protein
MTRLADRLAGRVRLAIGRPRPEYAGLRRMPQIVAVFQPVLPVLVGTPCSASHRAIRPIDSPS